MKIFILLLIIFNTFLLHASISTEVANIIRANHFKEKNLGILISNVNKPVYELNSNSPMIPASLTKIFTAGAVLAHFPMNTKFNTEVWSKGNISSQKLNGNICLKGGGDPSFVSERMWFLVNELTRDGFNKVTGDIIVDSSKFDQELFDSGRESVRVDRAFDAPISAMSFNWNSVNVFVRPGKNVGEPAQIFLDPENSYLSLENKTKTGKESSKKNIDVEREKSGDHDKIVVSGTMPINASEVVFYKGITNPPLWAGNHFKHFLKQRNIEVEGNIREGKCEDGSQKLASVDSKYLNEIVSDMLKFSNNFVAEMLAKNLGASLKPEVPASMKEGIEGIKNFLESNGINSKDYTLQNVSGLTRDNRFSANQISKILFIMKNDFQVFPEFLSALPIAGVDGTLKKRMKNSTDGLVRAKTGYLDGVVGLAGYIGRKNKDPLVFVFMYNGDYEEGLRARKLFDDIIERAKKWE